MDRNECDSVGMTFWNIPMEITPELREKVQEYHEYHGDTHIKIIRVVRDEVGAPALLVRLRDADGAKMSVIDCDMGDYISEITGGPREDEAEMLEWYQNEKETDRSEYDD